MICYLFLAWDNEVVIRAGAFIFCVGIQLAGATPNLREKFFPMVRRPTPPRPAKAPLTVGANQRTTPTVIRET